MTRTTFGLCTGLVAISGFAYACGSMGLDGSDERGGANTEGSQSQDAGAASAAPSSNADLVPVDNAVILVHAAKSQSFRLCFENEPDRLPQPDSQVMPEANVVGVEVGSAVRLGPLAGVPGKVFLFEEPLIRAFYPAFGGAGQGPKCGELLASPQLNKLATNLGPVEANLSKGVHLLVVRGCPSDSPLTTYSLAECGEGWTSASGNLSVKEITLTGANRTGDKILPAQVVNLSQPLEAARQGREVVVTFGDLVVPGAGHVSVASNPELFGGASPSVPALLSYPADDIAIYESIGFRVQLQAPAGDGGADAGGSRTVVLDQSLARVQKLSSPRDLPPPYYAGASNYALLLLGDPSAKLPDGGPDGDDRKNIHFLAVPVIDPKDDAGPPGPPTDGGGAP